MAKNYDKLKGKYAEWLALKNLGKQGEEKLTELGYPTTQKEFCKQYKISKNTPRNWQSDLGFWYLYHDIVQNELKVDLPAIMKMMGKKSPVDWYKTMYPKQAKEAFSQKLEHSGGITIEDTKKALGESFIVLENKEENSD